MDENRGHGVPDAALWCDHAVFAEWPGSNSVISEYMPLTKPQIIEAIAILDCLAQPAYQNAKDEFTVPGIGKLVVVDRKARIARNPQTGAEVHVPAKTALKFRISNAPKDAVLSSTTPPSTTSTATPSATS